METPVFSWDGGELLMRSTLLESRLSELDRLMLQMTHVQIPLDHLHFGSPDPHIGPEK